MVPRLASSAAPSFSVGGCNFYIFVKIILTDFIGNMKTATLYYPGTDKPSMVFEIIYDKDTGREERSIITQYTPDGGRIIQDLRRWGGLKTPVRLSRLKP